MNDLLRIIPGDCRKTLAQLESESVQCCVTSPPYWGLRDYDSDDQIGLETSIDCYVASLVVVFREVHRVLRDDATLWLNLGDAYSRSLAPSGPKIGKAIHTELDKARRKLSESKGSSDGAVGRGDRAATRNGCNGLPAKNLIGIPWRVAFALQDDGWILRSDIVWHKTNPMPESVTDRPTKAHEYIFLFAKNQRYFYDADAIKEPASDDTHARYARGRSDNHKHADGGPGNQTIAKTFSHMRSPGVNPKCVEPGTGVKQNSSFSAAVKDIVTDRNKRSVWTVPTFGFSGAHFATYPPDLIKPCILAGSRPGDTVLDPFGGSGTTGAVAIELGRKAILCEVNPDYCKLIEQRCRTVTPGLALHTP